MNTAFKNFILLLNFALFAFGQTDTTNEERHLLPLEEYVNISQPAGTSHSSPTAYTKDVLHSLKIGFDRNKILPHHGPQFIKVTTSVFNRDGSLYDKITQYAFTFAQQPTPFEEYMMMNSIAEKIMTFSFVNRRKIDTIDVHLDSLPDWAVIEVKVTPDEEFTKYERRSRTVRTWYFRAKGNRIETAFFLGVPKVLYDSEKHDTISYGYASAMVRFNYLNGETGEPYPFNIGIGTFGVSTPIDVSSKGGGFALSLMFDVIRALNSIYEWKIANKLNAGIEITPFFPINHRARILINARIGISP